ncbi:MAG TPA: hypothetical protein VIT45_08630 [Allosphingosinicella sp.]
MALFMAFASVTPALAELGCIEDQRAHSLGAAVSGDDNHGIENPAPVQGDEDSTGKTTHCGFSHASHGLAVPPAECADIGHEDGRQTFDAARARPLAAFARDGPYHPPQA